MVLEILDDTRCQTQKLCQDQSLHLSCLAEEQVLLKDLIRHCAVWSNRLAGGFPKNHETVSSIYNQFVSESIP